MGYTHFDGVDAALLKIAGTQVTATAAELNQQCDGATGVIKSISKVCAVGDFTDGTGASGYVDFDTGALPADCIVLGWKAVTTTAGAWDDDTTAVMTVGVAGATDKFSGAGTASVAAAGTVGDTCKLATAITLAFNEAAATPRVTVTGGSDFTAFVTAATCSSTVTIYYIELN